MSVCCLCCVMVRLFIKLSCIDLFLHSLSVLLNLEPICRDSGHKVGDNLDRVPTLHPSILTHTVHSHTDSQTNNNLEMPLNLQPMSLEWGRNWITQKKPQKHGGTFKIHAHILQVEFKPPIPKV